MSKAASRLSQFSAPGVSLSGVRSSLLLAASMAIVAATTVLSPMQANGAESFPPDQVVESIQASLDTELGEGRTIIGHAGMDMNEAFSKLGNGEVDILFRGSNDLPALEEYFRGDAGVFDVGEIEQEHLDRFMIYRQVTTAFAGPSPSENERTAFAGFAALRDGVPMEMLELIAAKAELDHLMGVDNPVSHTVLQHVMAVSNDQVVDNLPTFSLQDLEAISEQFANSSRRSVVPDAFGKALAEAMDNEAFFIPVQEGVVVGTAATWLDSAKKVPEIGRILELQAFLYDRNTTNAPYERFDADPGRTTTELAKLAMSGDTVARELAKAIGLPRDFRYAPIAGVEDLPHASEIAGEAILFNRDDLYVYTDKQSRAFFATTLDHSLVFIATPEGMHRTFYEQSGHDATYVEQVAAMSR